MFSGFERNEKGAVKNRGKKSYKASSSNLFNIDRLPFWEEC